MGFRVGALARLRRRYDYGRPKRVPPLSAGKVGSGCRAMGRPDSRRIPRNHPSTAYGLRTGCTERDQDRDPAFRALRRPVRILLRKRPDQFARAFAAVLLG